MGWARGSVIAEEIWEVVREHLPKAKRQEVAEKLIEIFEDNDCDTLDECETLMRDAGLDREEDDEEETEEEDDEL